MLVSEGDVIPPSLMGSIRICFVSPHVKKGSIPRPVTIEYHEDEERVVIRYSACYRNHVGFLQWGCDGRHDQLHGDVQEREMNDQKKEVEMDRKAREDKNK